MSPEHDERWSLAEELFAEFLGRHSSGDTVSFEALVAQHPKLEAELREMYDDRVVMGGLLGDLGGPEHGIASTPVDWGSFVDPERLFGEVLARLRSRAASFERYEDLEEIGRGGMGVVVRAMDRELGREVALKFLKSQWDAPASEAMPVPDARLLSRFFGEARTTSKLAHPGIPPVHEFGMDPRDRIYYAMELVEGEDFDSVIARVHSADDSWTEARALGILLTAARALAHAHEVGVVHRDLKPANLMIGEFGRVYVMDWGLAHSPWGRGEDRAAKSPDSQDKEEENSPLHTQPGQIVGTPLYMSPEQAEGDRDPVDARSDVYAMGAILYHLVAGNPPYCEDGKRPRAVAEAIEWVRSDSPAPVGRVAKGVAPELQAILERAMDRDIELRYRDMGELAEDLAAFLEGRVVVSYRTGAWVELRKWVGRNRVTAGAIGAALVLLVAGLVSGMVLRSIAAEASATAAEATAAEARATLQRLTESSLRRAELASQRGGWEEVLQLLEETRERGYPDELELDLLRAEALVALARRAEASALLDTLAQRADAGSRLSSIQLLQGVLALSDWSEQELAVGLVESAIASGSLAPADQEFAQGLIEETVPAALAAFQRALEIDPFHHGAHDSSITVLILSGQLDEAHSRAESIEILYPEDPIGPMTRIFVLGLRDELEEAKEVVEEARTRGIDASGMEAFLEVIAAIPRMDDLTIGSRMPSFGDLADPVMKAMQSQGLKSLEQIYPNLPCVAESWGTCFEGMIALIGGPKGNIFALAQEIMGGKKDLDSLGEFQDFEAALPFFQKAAQANPDGVMSFFQAACEINVGPMDPRLRLDRWQRAEALFERASRAQSVLPEVSRAARYWVIHTQAMLYGLSGRTDQAVRQRGLRNVQIFMSLDTTNAGQFKELARKAIELEDPGLAQALLARASDLGPENVGLLRTRMQLALEQGRFADATARADRILELEPGNREAVEAREASMRGAVDQAIQLEDY